MLSKVFQAKTYCLSLSILEQDKHQSKYYYRCKLTSKEKYLQIYYFQCLHGSFFEQKIQGLFKFATGQGLHSEQKTALSLSLFLVLQQHQQLHPEGFFVFAGLDKD